VKNKRTFLIKFTRAELLRARTEPGRSGAEKRKRKLIDFFASLFIVESVVVLLEIIKKNAS